MKPFPRYFVYLIALLTLVIQGHLCHWFDSWGIIPLTIDNNPGNYKQLAYQFPPQGRFFTDYWLGNSVVSPALNALTLLANLPTELFFKLFYPLFAALSILTSYALFRHWGFSSLVSLLTATIYGWQGDLLSNIYAGHFAPAPQIALIPLLFLTLDRSLLIGSYRYGLIAGGIFGEIFTLLPDRAMLVGVMISAFTLFRITTHPDIRSTTKSLIKRITLLLCGALFSLFIALPTLVNYLPQQLEGVSPTGGDSKEARFSWATQWSCAPEEVIHWLVPGFLGWKTGDDEAPYWGRVGQSLLPPESPSYLRNYSIGYGGLGTLAMIAGLYGLWVVLKSHRSPQLKRDQKKIHLGHFFGCASLIFLILALGRFTPLYQYLLSIPGMESWRNPIKWLLPATFSFFFLIALGLQQVHRMIHHFRKPNAERPLPIILLGWSVIVNLVVFITLWLAQPVTHIILDRAGYSTRESIAIAATMVSSWGAMTLLLAVTWGLLRQVPRQQFWERALREIPNPIAQRFLIRQISHNRIVCSLLFILLGLHVFQLRSIHHHYVHSLNYQAAHAPSDLTRKLTSVPQARVKISGNDSWMHYWLTSTFPHLGIPSIDIPAASRIPKDYQQWFNTLSENPNRLWELSGTRFLLATASEIPNLISNLKISPPPQVTFYKAYKSNDGNDVVVSPTAQDATHALAELPFVLNKITFVPKAEVFESDEKLYERLKSTNWNPRESILLTTKPPELPQIPPSPQKLSINLETYSSTRITARVEAPQAGYLLVNDRYDAAWKAKIDEHPTETLRANGIQRAIPFPGGSHLVTFEYKTNTTTVWIQLIAYLMLIALVSRVLIFKSKP